ncbi:MAG TPA: hypothetical protein VKE69_02980 [Planctomycetota bacterium]|nr:hypothetical protein [Planctomycetota bacterium]
MTPRSRVAVPALLAAFGGVAFAASSPAQTAPASRPASFSRWCATPCAIGELQGLVAPAEIAAARDRLARIEAELAKIEKHAWAGVYRFADGSVIHVAPRSGLVFFQGGCLGFAAVTFGDVAEAAPGRIRFDAAPRADLESPEALDADLVSFDWQGGRYLVPAGRMLEFCNAANADDASPPGTGPFPAFALDRKTEPSTFGLPPLPEEFARWLLPKPVTARVLAVQEIRRDAPETREDAGAAGEVELRVRLDVGRTRGLAEGLLFYTQCCDADAWEVLSVRSRECVVGRRLPADARMRIPEVGEKLSTRRIE